MAQCCYCHRKKDKILHWSTEEGEAKKQKKQGQVPILYVDAKNNLICERCSAHTQQALKYGGSPIMIFNRKTGKFLQDAKKLSMVNHELVQESAEDSQRFF